MRITLENIDQVVAHQPNTDYLMPGEMVKVRYPQPPPDNKELEWQNCGNTHDTCKFTLGINQRRCGLDFYTRKDGALEEITLRETECVACGQRPAAKER